MGALEDLWQLAQGAVDPQSVRAIVAAFAFVNPFLSYVLATVLARRVHTRLILPAFIVFAALMTSLLFGVLDLLVPVSLLGFANFLLKVGVIVWTAGLVLLIIILYRVLSVDRKTFRKPKLSAPFQRFQRLEDGYVSQFGLGCLDPYLKQSTTGKDAFTGEDTDKHELYFPILLVAGKRFRPWRIAAKFAASGLSNGEGVVYFSFNQPSSIAIDGLARRYANVRDGQADPAKWWQEPKNKAEAGSFDRLRLIDCHSRWIGEHITIRARLARIRARLARNKELSGRKPQSPYQEVHDHANVVQSDPRDPIGLSLHYERALAELAKSGVRSLRVVYDSISDFLLYSDPSLAVQFIKHNMVWEDQNNANSLYVFVPGVPRTGSVGLTDEEFLRWNAYCVVTLKHEASANYVEVEGLLSETVRKRITMAPGGDYIFLEKDH